MPAAVVRGVDKRQRMLHAGEVRLRRKGEQVGAGAIGLIEECWSAPDGRRADSGTVKRRVVHTGALRARELPDPVYRVVVVGHEKPSARAAKRIGLANQLQRTGRI